MPIIEFDGVESGIISLMLPAGTPFEVPDECTRVDLGLVLFDWESLIPIELRLEERTEQTEQFEPRINIAKAMFTWIGPRYREAFARLVGSRICDEVEQRLETNALRQIDVTQQELDYIVSQVNKAAQAR